MGRKLVLAFIIIFSCLFGFAEGYDLYFYGVVTNVSDDNMVKITQDLFSAQIRNMNGINLIDERENTFKQDFPSMPVNTAAEDYFSKLPSKSSDGPVKNLSFFTKIYRPQSDENWECTFYVLNHTENKIYSESKKYDSYYKILTVAKTSIQDLIWEATGMEGSDQSFSGLKNRAQNASGTSSFSLESLAGTWGGEKDAAKIILLRSGRGFIIFNNGASMNINITVIEGSQEKKLHIVQEGKFNASFYPEISRKDVLEYADKAKPIEWDLSLTSDGLLKGEKKTLQVSADNTVEPGSVDVTWSRRQ